MNFATLFAGLGSSGLFASRAFLPAFAAACLLRWGEHVPVLRASSFMEGVAQSAPGWFTHDATIAILGALAALEWLANRNPEARRLMDAIGTHAKTAMAALTFFGVLDASGVGFLRDNFPGLAPEGDASAAPAGPARAGLFDYAAGALVAGVTWGLARLRDTVAAALADADEGDAIGIGGLLAWAEDLWAAGGLVLLLLYPPLMVALTAAVGGLLALVAGWLRRREERSRVPCPACGAPCYQVALACPACGAETPEPREIGLFAGPTDRPAGEPARHRFRLLERGRCPRCATRLAGTAPRQPCAACGAVPFPDAGDARAYAGRVAGRLPMTIVATALFSLIPVVGLIPGVIFYRLAVVAPFRPYTPLLRNLGLRLALRFLFLLLILLQIAPLLGVLAVPLMAVISFLAYRRSFLARAAA